MAENKKPINPLEREENVGIVDGSDHTGEHVTSSRHGVGDDPGQGEKAGRIPTSTRTDSAPSKADRS